SEFGERLEHRLLRMGDLDVRETGLTPFLGGELVEGPSRVHSRDATAWGGRDEQPEVRSPGGASRVRATPCGSCGSTETPCGTATRPTRSTRRRSRRCTRGV